MDDGRFDSLTRALASGASRRSVLKGLLGLGAAAVTGATLDETSEAARRPTPTPRPVTCPGNQTWNGAKCVCPTGLSQCNPGSGPACCNDQNVDPGGPGFSTCCDNACCQGTCYGEERCCATNNRPGEQPPTHRICETLDGDACCAYSDVCCPVDGCCSTVCTDGACCAPDDFCPGGSESVDLCCAGTTSCCNGSTNFNACVDLGSPNACCIDANCDNPPSGSSPCAVGTCAGHVCHYTDCAAGSICCPDTTGDFACRVGDECCLTNRDCEDTCEACDDFVCVDDPDTFPCGPDDDPDRFCCPATNYTLCCPGAQGQCCGIDAAREITRECMPDGACCPLDAPSYCADSGVCCVQLCTETGGKELCCAEGEFGCNGDCCPNADTCCDGECCAGQCIREEAQTEVCCPSDGSFVCNGNACCTDDQNCCSSDGCCDGHCDSAGHCCPDENSFLCAGACCPNDNTCCGAGTEFEFCCPPGQCNPASGACCAAGNFPCGESCCPNADTCCDGACCAGPCIREELDPELCCPSEGSFICNTNECCLDAQHCCSVDGCCDGQCSDLGRCCPSQSDFICDGECCPFGHTCCGVDDSETCCAPGQCNATSGACCTPGSVPCGQTCCATETSKCCDGACVAPDFPCCSVNEDCGPCETCNPQTRMCSSLCTSQLPQCCVTGGHEYCVADGSTCCVDAGDCAPCAYCTGTPDNPGYCIDDCPSGSICCTEGAADDCCTADEQCVTGHGCCSPLDLCGDECCGPETRCCTNQTGESHCIPNIEGSCCLEGECSGWEIPQDCKVGHCEGIPAAFSGTCISLSFCDVSSPQCCPNAELNFPGNCIPETDICCLESTQCPDSPVTCQSGVCFEEIFCTLGEPACPENETCLSGHGCCPNADLCGGECCGSDSRCCTNLAGESQCISNAEDACCIETDCGAWDDTQHCIVGHCEGIPAQFSGTCAPVSFCDVSRPQCCPGPYEFSLGQCVPDDRTCCIDSTQCPDSPETCQLGVCQFDQTCGLDTTYCPSPGECCADGFCSDAALECCGDDDCTMPDDCTPADCIDHACTTTSVCVAPDSTCCGTNAEGCIDTQTDENNCGTCGTRCTGCADCVGGECVADDTECGDCEICTLDGNDGSCGPDPACPCTPACTNKFTCVNGQCVCPSPYEVCTIPDQGDFCFECCGGDSNCANFGFDTECIRCSARGSCLPDIDNRACQVGSGTAGSGGANGYCSDGVCEPCLADTLACTVDNQCCSHCCSNDFCAAASVCESEFALQSIETDKTSSECTPATCDQLGCGKQDDGCGTPLDCGECCTPKDFCLDTDCGPVDDGCGGALDCPCPQGPVVEQPVGCVVDGDPCDPTADICCDAEMICAATARGTTFICRLPS